MPPTTRVRVQNRYPLGAATGILTTASLYLVFNIDMLESSLNTSNIMLLKVNSEEVDITLSYDAFNRKLTITPVEDLEPSTTYYVYVRGTESDEDDDPTVAGVLGTDNQTLIGYYSTFFGTEASALEAPILEFPPMGAAVAQSEIVAPRTLFRWGAVEVYATDTTTTVTSDGAILADIYVINGTSIIITARATEYSSYENALYIAELINSSGASVVATAQIDGTMTIRSNTVGDNPVAVSGIGTHNIVHLDELGAWTDNPLDPGNDAYVIVAEDVTYEIEVAEESLFSAPEFTSSDISEVGITPGTALPVSTQLYWRVRAATASVTSQWSELGMFYNGVDETATGDDAFIAPYVDPFRVTSHLPDTDIVNYMGTYITVYFNDDMYTDSIDSNSIQVIGKSLVAWEPDVGEVEGVVELLDDGMILRFTPNITFGATISWDPPPDIWDVDTIRIHRSTSKQGKYTHIDTVTTYGTPFVLPTTYTDTTVLETSTDVYWYRVEFLSTPNPTTTPDDEWWPTEAPEGNYNIYPMLEPVPGRFGGFVDNQIYRITVSKDIYSSTSDTTTTMGVDLGQDYEFYFTTLLHPLYISVTELETVVGSELLSKFSTIDIYSLILRNSYAAYKVSIYPQLNNTLYTLDQFSDLSDMLGSKASRFACFVTYQTALDLLKRDILQSSSIGKDVQIGDYRISDLMATAGTKDPRLHEWELLALACLSDFSYAWYKDVANWAVKSSPTKYVFPPYGRGEARSFWSDRYHLHKGW